MVRPGKAVFDVGMMAGWAFVAVLTGLIALSMVDDSGDPLRERRVLAARDTTNAPIITSSIREPGTASTNKQSVAELLKQQKQTYDPFTGSSQKHNAQISQMLVQLKSLQREVDAFHSSTKKLRDENARLKHRIGKLETVERKGSVRVVELPKKNDDRNGIILKKVELNKQPVDMQSTGSIQNRPLVPEQGQSFDPFSISPSRGKPALKVSEQPLDMDIKLQAANGVMALPKRKPVAETKPVEKATGEKLRPSSQVVQIPKQVRSASQTAFGLDLGRFVSLSELSSAWKEIALSQRSVVGDLRPLSFVSQDQSGRLALNLLAGPIQNAAQAATLCASLHLKGYDCKVSSYQGQAVAQR